MNFSLLTAYVLAAAELPLVPAFEVRSAHAAPLTGAIERIGLDWSVSLTGATPASVPGSDVIALRRVGERLPGDPLGPQVLFANGDRLRCMVLDVANDHARLSLRFTDQPGEPPQEIRVPLSLVSVLWLERPARLGAADSPRRRRLDEPRRADLVMLDNGDTLTGTLITLGRLDAPEAERVVTVSDDGKTVSVPRARVIAVGLNPSLTRSPRTKGVYARAIFVDGGRLTLAGVTANPRILTGKTPFGAVVTVPLDRLAALDLRGGRAVPLSSLKPTKYEHTSYLGATWPYQVDRSVRGGPLRLNGGVYDSGLGTHTQSRLTYSLDGRYRRFEALVGLDDAGGREGAVRLRVHVDGKARDVGLPADRDLRYADGPRWVNVDVTGCDELTLEVNFGQDGGVWTDGGNDVNWADARLIK